MITIPFEYVNEVWIPITNKSVKDVKVCQEYLIIQLEEI